MEQRLGCDRAAGLHLLDGGEQGVAFVRGQLLKGDQAGTHHLAFVDRQGRLQRVLDDRLDKGLGR